MSSIGIANSESTAENSESFPQSVGSRMKMKESQGDIIRRNVEITESTSFGRLAYQMGSTGTVAVASSKGSDCSLGNEYDQMGNGAKAKGDAKPGCDDATDSLLIHNDELEVLPKLFEPEGKSTNLASESALSNLASPTKSEHVEELMIPSIGFVRSATLHQESDGTAGTLDTASSRGRDAINVEVGVGMCEAKAVGTGSNMLANANMEKVGTTQHKFEQKELNHGGFGDSGFQYHGDDDFGEDFPLCDDDDDDDGDELNKNDGDIFAETVGELEAGLDPSLSFSPPLLSPSTQKKRKSICASPSGSLDLTKSSESSDEKVSEVKVGHHQSKKDKTEVVDEIEINSDDSSMVSSLARAESIDDGDENASIYSWRTHTGPDRPLCSLQKLDSLRFKKEY